MHTCGQGAQHNLSGSHNEEGRSGTGGTRPWKSHMDHPHVKFFNLSGWHGGFVTWARCAPIPIHL